MTHVLCLEFKIRSSSDFLTECPPSPNPTLPTLLLRPHKQHNMGIFRVSSRRFSSRCCRKGVGGPRARWHLWLELRRVRDGHVPVQGAQHLPSGGERGAGDGVGRVRHSLHGALHGHARGKSQGLQVGSSRRLSVFFFQYIMPPIRPEILR